MKKLLSVLIIASVLICSAGAAENDYPFKVNDGETNGVRETATFFR